MTLDTAVRPVVVTSPEPPYTCPILPPQPPSPPAPTRPSRRRSRQTLVSGVVVFVLVQMVLGWLLQERLESWRDPAYGPKAERLQQSLEAAPQRPSVVILGSSRVAWGVRAHAVEEAFAEDAPVTAYNFGLTGAGSVQQLLVLQRLLEAGIRPDTLVIEVLPPLFAGAQNLDEMHRMPLDRFRRSERGFALKWGAEPDAFDQAQRRATLLPSYTNRLAILQNVSPELVPFEYREDWYQNLDAWGTSQVPHREATAEDRRHACGIAHAHYQMYFAGFPLGGRPQQALRELLELCRKEGIRTVLLWMPEGPEFRSWYPEAATTEIEAFLSELQREYGVGMVRAREWMPEEAFVDSHHLLPESATVFSQRLGRELAQQLGCGSQ